MSAEGHGADGTVIKMRGGGRGSADPGSEGGGGRGMRMEGYRDADNRIPNEF